MRISLNDAPVRWTTIRTFSSGPMTCGPSSACSTRESAGDTYLPLNASGNGDLSDDQIEESKQKYIGRLGKERVDLQRKWWISEVRRR